MSPDPAGDTSFYSSLPDHLEHLRLEVDRDHQTLFTHESSQTQRRKPPAAAEIQCGHSRTNVRPKQFWWTMEKGTEEIVEQMDVLPRAHPALFGND
jgi:hypothetical protein